MVQHVAEGFVHAFDERGIAAGGRGVGGIGIMGGEAAVRLERVVDRVVGQVQEEGFSGRDGRIHLRQGFQGQGLRQESLRPMVFVQPRHGPGTDAPDQSVAVLAQVAAGFADGGTGYIDLEPQVQRVLSFAVEGSEMPLAYVDGPVPGRLQDAGEGGIV